MYTKVYTYLLFVGSRTKYTSLQVASLRFFEKNRWLDAGWWPNKPGGPRLVSPFSRLECQQSDQNEKWIIVALSRTGRYQSTHKAHSCYGVIRAPDKRVLCMWIPKIQAAKASQKSKFVQAGPRSHCSLIVFDPWSLLWSTLYTSTSRFCKIGTCSWTIHQCVWMHIVFYFNISQCPCFHVSINTRHSCYPIKALLLEVFHRCFLFLG